MPACCAEALRRPGQQAEGVLRDLASTLKLAEPGMVPEAVQLLQCAAVALPDAQRFCADVCKVGGMQLQHSQLAFSCDLQSCTLHAGRVHRS